MNRSSLQPPKLASSGKATRASGYRKASANARAVKLLGAIVTLGGVLPLIRAEVDWLVAGAPRSTEPWLVFALGILVCGIGGGVAWMLWLRIRPLTAPAMSGDEVPDTPGDDIARQGYDYFGD